MLVIIIAIFILRSFLISVPTKVPSDAILLNAMDAPSFDGVLETDEWKKATHLTINFTFENGETHPADIYLGHDNEAFFVGAAVWQVGPNPYSFPDGWWFPDALVLYFDTDNDGKLTTPEDAKVAFVVIGIENNSELLKDAWVSDWYWNNSLSSKKIEWAERRPSLNAEVYWGSEEEASSLDNIIFKYFHNSIAGYDPLDGTEYFEFGFELNPQDIMHDGLHIKPGELKVVGLTIEYYRQRGFNDTVPLGPEIWDDWPGDGYTPDVFVNATKYAKMAIDLRKSPLFFLETEQFICLPLISVSSFKKIMKTRQTIKYAQKAVTGIFTNEKPII
jgi:hypothetical protein